MIYPCDTQIEILEVDDYPYDYTVPTILLSAKENRTILNITLNTFEATTTTKNSFIQVWCYTEAEKMQKQITDYPLVDNWRDVFFQDIDIFMPCNEDISIYAHDYIGGSIYAKLLYVDRLLTEQPQCSELQASSTPQVSQGFTYGEIFTGCFLFVFSLALITGFIIKKVYHNDNK